VAGAAALFEGGEVGGVDGVDGVDGGVALFCRVVDDHGFEGAGDAFEPGDATGTDLSGIGLVDGELVGDDFGGLEPGGKGTLGGVVKAGGLGEGSAGVDFIEDGIDDGGGGWDEGWEVHEA